MSWTINRTTLLVLLTAQLKGVNTIVQDPCPSGVTRTTVAEMCTDSSAVEEDPYTNDGVNSVIIKQMTQNNCSCHVYFDNQSEIRQLRVKKYKDYIASFPEKTPCGLVIDMKFINQTHPQSILPLECDKGSETRYFNLNQTEGLQFTSRVTEGQFDRGYCVQVIRESVSGSFRLRLKCSDALSTEVSNTRRSSLMPTGVSRTPQSSFMPTGVSRIPQSTHDSGVHQTDSELNIHIAVGVCSGVVVVLVIAVVLFIRRKNICKPKTETKDNSQNYSAEQNIEDNVEYNGVRDNILNVPSNEHDLYDGNYSTVNENGRKFTNKVDGIDVNYSTIDINVPDDSSKNTSGKNVPNGKQKPTIQPKPKTPKPISDNASLDISENDITHIRPPTGSGDVYAVVGKRKTTLQSDTENDGDVCCPDQTYSVVNKAQK